MTGWHHPPALSGILEAQCTVSSESTFAAFFYLAVHLSSWHMLIYWLIRVFGCSNLPNLMHYLNLCHIAIASWLQDRICLYGRSPFRNCFLLWTAGKVISSRIMRMSLGSLTMAGTLIHKSSVSNQSRASTGCPTCSLIGSPSIPVPHPQGSRRSRASA